MAKAPQIKISITPTEADQLTRWAESEGLRQSTKASAIVKVAIAQALESGEIPDAQALDEATIETVIGAFGDTSSLDAKTVETLTQRLQAAVIN